MKMIFWIMGVLAVIYFMSAVTSTTKSIDGRSQRSAQISMKKMKRYMTSQEQHQFEASFGLLGEIKSKEGPEAFLETVDGKTPEEIIELARKEFSEHLAAGDPQFTRYGSWDNWLGIGQEAGKMNGKDAQPLRSSSRTGRDESIVMPAGTR